MENAFNSSARAARGITRLALTVLPQSLSCNWRRRVSRLAVFVACLSLPVSALAAIPSPEKLLPENTLVMVTVPDFARLRDALKTSPQMQFWNDPAMKPFRDKFVARFKEQVVQPLEHTLGVRLQDYARLPQGQVTLALTQNGWLETAGRAPAFLLLLDTKDQSGLLQTNLAALRHKWVDSGRSIKTEKIRGVEFYIFPISSLDIPEAVRKTYTPTYAGEDHPADDETNEPAGELVAGQYESLLIVGTSLKAVEKVVVHLTGGAMPALGDLAAYESDRLALFRDAPLYGWANVQTLLDLLNRKSARQNADAPNPFPFFDPAKILTATGVGGLKTLAWTSRFSREGTLFQFFAGAPAANRQGLFKILPDAKEAGPPPFVPATALTFQRWRLDGQKAWSTLKTVLNDISPQLMSGLNLVLDTANAAARESDPGFDLEKNFFGNLGDDIIRYQQASAGGAPVSLLLIGSPRPDELAAALKYILLIRSPQAAQPKEREFLGRKIFSVPIGPVTMSPDGNAQPTGFALNYSASGGYLAISTDVSTLEAYLRSGDGQQKPLRETMGLREAAAEVGGFSTGIFGYENQAATWRATFEALRKNPNASATQPSFLSGVMGLPHPERMLNSWTDFSLLPPFDQVAKYFHFTVYAVSANADGITFKSFTPTPPQLRK